MAFHEYPYTDFHEMNLDWVIAKVKELTLAWAQTSSDWEELRTFVNDYFANLNVQEEINNKMDELVSDGTLSSLIAPYVASGLPAEVANQIAAVVADQIGAVVAAQLPAQVAEQIPGAVAGEAANWLSEHVDPSTGYVVDDSLTIAGAAADAKTSGDRISEVKSDLYILGEWQSRGFTVFAQKQVAGFLNNDGTIKYGEQTLGLVDDEYMKILEGKYFPYIKEPYFSLKIAVYDSNKQLVNISYYYYNDFLAEKLLDIKAAYPTAEYYRYAISSNDSTNHPVYVGCAFFRLENTYINDIKELNNDMKSIFDQDITYTEQNGYLLENDTYAVAPNYHSKSTTYLDCKEGDKFNYYGNGEYSAVSWIFYMDRNIISSGKYIGQTVVTIPENINGVKFSSYGPINQDVLLEVSKVTIESRLDEVESELMQGYAQLKGKKIGFDGDSICYGQGNNGGYAKILKDNYGMITQNISVAGGTIANNTYYQDSTPRHWICETVVNLSTDNDLIIIEGGVNDFWQNVPIGAISNGYSAALDKSTFYGAIETIFKILRTTFIGKKVGFIIVHKVNEGMSSPDGLYYNAILECAEKWGVPILDLNNTCPPFGLMDSNYQSEKDAYTVSGDGVHPNPLGYSTFYAPKIAAWLCTI